MSDTQNTNMHTSVSVSGLLFMMVSMMSTIRVAVPWLVATSDYPKHHSHKKRARCSSHRLPSDMFDLNDTREILNALGINALHVVCHFMSFCVIVVCRVAIAVLHASIHVLHQFSSVGLSSVGRGLPTLCDFTTGGCSGKRLPLVFIVVFVSLPPSVTAWDPMTSIAMWGTQWFMLCDGPVALLQWLLRDRFPMLYIALERYRWYGGDAFQTRSTHYPELLRYMPHPFWTPDRTVLDVLDAKLP